MDRAVLFAAAGGDLIELRYRRWKNHPVAGVDFPDTAPFAVDGLVMRQVIDALSRHLPADTEVVAGIDIGGLGFAGALAYCNGVGLIDIRKIGSIRTEVIRSIVANYDLGNGVAVSKANRLEGRRVAVLDDCLMSGGTALAAAQLLRRLGAICVTALFVFELDGMGGRATLEGEGLSVHSLLALPRSDADQAGG